MAIDNYKREITHKGYKNSKKLKKYHHIVEKKVFEKPSLFKLSKKEHKDFVAVNDSFIVSKTGSLSTEIMTVSILLIITLILVFPIPLKYEIKDLVFVILSVLSTVFFLIYTISMPKKEHILNRKNGLVSFTGFFWQKNITMQFDNAEFAYSTGGENMTGAYMLQAIRPNKWQTFDIYTIFGKNCYDDMSFICWYMDSSRPLPPGEAFDEFRDKDFERRKAEGFPKPLYPSMIETPEATKEQQAERKRVGGW